MISLEKEGEYRPILHLRAFDNLNKVMHYEFEYMSVKDKGSIVFQSDIQEFNWGQWPPEGEYEIGGLDIMRDIMVRDKNNERIYDLDIVRVLYDDKAFSGVVVMNSGGCPFVKGDNDSKFFDSKEAIFEVIGNVYENEELCPKFWIDKKKNNLNT